jgi:hypothetical protein
MDYSEFIKKFGISKRQQEKKPPVVEPVQSKPPDAVKLTDMDKASLIQFAGRRKLFDKSFKELEPAAIISAILEKAKSKVVEAKLKTAEEAASLAESELFALYDTIKS